MRFVASSSTATATRTAAGWKTVSTIPGPPPSVVGDFVSHVPQQEFLSDDATAMQFYATFPYVDSPLLPAAPGADSLYVAHTLSGSIEWLNRPVAADAAPMPGSYTSNTIGRPAGGSPDFRTSYFSFCGTLVAEDAPRVGQSANFGFYVARDGVVHSAGTLPDGSLDPLGAVPAGDPRLGCSGNSTFSLEDQAARGNQVSRDGSRAFFLSPNAYAANGAPNGRPPQLYVHREGKSSLLISRSLADPATPTPAGVSRVNDDSYVMATPDGRYVVFGSTDRLTADAPSGSTVPLRYRFDVETEQLTYLPGLDGRLVAISEDGQRILFGRSGPSGNAPRALRSWDGPGHRRLPGRQQRHRDRLPARVGGRQHLGVLQHEAPSRRDDRPAATTVQRGAQLRGLPVRGWRRRRDVHLLPGTGRAVVAGRER